MGSLPGPPYSTFLFVNKVVSTLHEECPSHILISAYPLPINKFFMSWPLSVLGKISRVARFFLCNVNNFTVWSSGRISLAFQGQQPRIQLLMLVGLRVSVVRVKGQTIEWAMGSVAR